MPFCKFVQTYEMQRLLLIIFASFFLGISCKKSVPEGIMSRSEMTDMMVEIHLIDGYLNGLNVDSARKVIDGLYGQVFEKHGIDSSLFKKNIAYYLGDPDVAKTLYDEVNKNLTKYEAGYRTEDSIRNVFVMDSMRTVQRFTKLKDEGEKMILKGKEFGEVYTYKNAATRFMEQAGLTLNVYGEQIPLQVAPPMSPKPLEGSPVSTAAQEARVVAPAHADSALKAAELEANEPVQ